MVQTRLFLEQDPPTQAIHAGVVGFIVLVFIVARVLTTRGFAALKPGFNTRAIVTWLACTSLTLMVVYSCLIARTLYKESMAGYYPGPPVSANYEPPSNITPFQFPVSVSFQDMSGNSEWDLSNITPPPQMDFNYVLAMKPISLYSLANRHFLFALRIVLKVSQSGLMACLLLLNTYWCSHVEALVDEGNFMSKTEMYMYWTLAALVIIFPVTVFVGIGYGTNSWQTASRVSDLLLLLLGLTIILGYIMTCLRLRALERDSRDVNGDDTPTTLQLTYYVYCIYWLIGSMFAILVLGILYEFTLVSPAKCPVLAQVVNDIQGSLWSTLVILVYPAAMFLLYPSVDVLTKPENDPAARFQKRVRRTVKDATRIRESFYLESDSANGIETGHHSSFYGLTSNSGVSLRQSDNGQPQQNQQHQQQQQRQSIYEPKRREHMGSITAAVNEMQLIVEEEGAGPLEVIRDVDDKSVFNSLMYDASTNSATNIETERSSKDETIKSPEGTDSPSPNEGERDAVAVKSWLLQDEHLTGAREVPGKDKHALHEQQVMDESHSTPSALTNVAFPAAYNVISPTSEDFAMKPIHEKPKSSAATMKTAHATHSKSAAPPLTGILKTRASASSGRSSVGQNPSDSTGHGGADVPSKPTRSAPAYGVRTSFAQASQHMPAGPRKSSENMPVRRRTSSGSSRHNLATSSSAPNLSAIPSAQSPTSQQRRSNVTGRVDASALALAAQQHHQYPQNHSHSQQDQKPRTSSDGVEIDYFGLRKFSFENHPNATPTSPPPLPYEPQAQGAQQVELVMSPTMTGFLMADPYPSAGTRHFDGSDSEQGPASTITLSDSQEDLGGSETTHRRTGSAGSSKKYKAPPPPIPTDLANIGADVNRKDNGTMPTTPMTPTTPPGVRPGRSLDTVVDRQFIEMANQMYDDHIVPPHVLQNIASAGSMDHKASVSPSLTTRMHQPWPSSLPPASQAPTPPAPVIRNDTLQATTAGQQQQQQQELDSPSQRGVSPPTKSPYRARESFESRLAQTGTPSASSGQNVTGGPGPSTPPSPVSTASPTIASAATLPRPLTPAWYETKTNFASTNDVLSHYNAVMRGGNHQPQQQQKHQHQYQQAGQGIANEQYFQQNAIGPLDKVSIAQRPSEAQYLPPIHPMQMLTTHPQQHPAARPQQLNQQQNQGQTSRQDYAQPRMGSADSFGVIRKPLSQRKEDPSRSSLQNMHPNEQQQQQRTHQQQQLPDIDRHSFMMASESISAYSTWTGDLSDVTNTSGEVSVGAFLDRKQASTTQYQRRKSAEKPTSSSLSASTNSGGHSIQGQPRSDERGNTQDVRKSQASAYSMGSSFGAGSSSRQSGGAYSNYSNNSGFGSGPLVVSASLSSDGHSSGANNTNSDSGGAGAITAGLPSRRQSASHKKRASGGGHGTTVGGAMDDASGNEMTSSRPNTMRLSAFGPDDHDHHAPPVDHRAGDQSRETSTTDKAFYLDDVDAQTLQERERRIQQEWMDRRAAVKKDSSNRLEQLHKQQQELEEHERHLLEQLHKLRTEEGQRPQELEEPYKLNSVYFKSSAEILNQLGSHPPSPPSMAQASSSQEYPSSKTESASLSVSESPAPAVSLCESPTRSIITATTESSSPSQHPAMALTSASTPEFNKTSRSYDVASAQPSSYHQSQASERSYRSPRNINDSADDADSLIQSSSSYAQHHLRQRSSPMQEQQPMNPSLLHYDSLDSIATVRAVHQPHPYSASSPPLTRSALSSPTSSSPSMQRPLYSPYQHQQHQQQQQQQQSQQFNGHPTQSSQNPSSVQGYPQHWIATPEDRERASPSGGSVGSDTHEYRGNSVASRTMSPVQRTSSRLTNVTNAESEYQWESAELNHHRWEMMETPPKSQ
ncbi:hypothetical protein BGZ67_009607 [Mortierella alpina]|nr:hypothetical protein BGZ67_009607 [Mortierella alpina]